jgi:anti-sigma regulatory factor (Ser/Thr protein kinase)
MNDELQFQIASDPVLLRMVRDRIAAWLNVNGWDATQVAEIVLALDEALSNVMRHGYGGARDRIILVRVRWLPCETPHEIEIRVRDFGRQVEPCRIAGRKLEEVRPGGLGVHLIHAMMTSVEYIPAAGGGMLLIMRKHRSHRAECERE